MLLYYKHFVWIENKQRNKKNAQRKATQLKHKPIYLLISHLLFGYSNISLHFFFVLFCYDRVFMLRDQCFVAVCVCICILKIQ